MTRWWPVPVVALLAALPALLTPYTSDLVVQVFVLAVFALSLELLVGMTGLVSLGHAAFYGIGAYVAVLASPAAGAGNLLVLLGASVGAAALYALFVGAFSLRTRGVYFIMVTLAFSQMAYFVFHDTGLAGGSDGLFLGQAADAGAARRRQPAPVLLPRAGRAGVHLRAARAAAAVALRPCAGRHPRQRAAHARGRLRDHALQARRLRDRRRAGRARGLPARAEGRRGEPRAAVLARDAARCC